jgi:hypothetical protein
MNWRLLAPVGVSEQTIAVNGRGYTATPGMALDVIDSDAQILTANGWIKIAPSGPTSARPTPSTLSAPYIAAPGFQFFDTSLNKIIAFDGATWRDPATGNAA